MLLPPSLLLLGRGILVPEGEAACAFVSTLCVNKHIASAQSKTFLGTGRFARTVFLLRNPSPTPKAPTHQPQIPIAPLPNVKSVVRPDPTATEGVLYARKELSASRVEMRRVMGSRSDAENGDAVAVGNDVYGDNPGKSRGVAGEGICEKAYQSACTELHEQVQVLTAKRQRPMTTTIPNPSCVQRNFSRGVKSS